MTTNLLEKVANAKSNPSVTVSMKTHRTFPDCDKDVIRMKNLFKEASERLLAEFDKNDAQTIIEKLDKIAADYNFKHSLDSLHIFASKDMVEVVKSPWAVDQNKVHISEGFSIKPLIIMRNREAQYLILVLSKSGTRLLRAENDIVVEEIQNDFFPSTENPFTTVNNTQNSDSEKVDKLLLEYFNRVDKAVVKVHQELGLNCIIVTTEDNHTKYQKIADKPSIYIGLSPINYNDNSDHSIVKSAWALMQEKQKAKRTEAIETMKKAVNQGQVVTDLQEAYRAAKEGRADLLVAYQQYLQPVKMTGEFSFDLVDDVTLPGVIDDVVSEIAREVIARKGRVVFTNQDEIKTLGKIALKLRY